MASVVRTTSFAAGAVISNTAARLHAIHVDQATAGASGNTFVMIYDQATAPTGGTDTPAFVAEIQQATETGFKGRHKFVFPGGGLRLGTGIGLFVATAFNGATGVTTTAPAAVDVFYDLGN